MLVGDPLVAPIRPMVPKRADWRLERDVASGHGDTLGNCLSPGKRFRQTTQVRGGDPAL